MSLHSLLKQRLATRLVAAMASSSALMLGAFSGCATDSADMPDVVEADPLSEDAPLASTPRAAMAQAACSTPKVAWANPGSVSNPVVAPIAETAGKNQRAFDPAAGMEEFDYRMDEYTFTGTSPSYTTRMMVRRPKDPAKFSGSVFVEWYNVSGGIDVAVMWASSREYFMREGHAYISVSAQAAGANALRSWDAERYGALKHPGDTAASAIFSQAGAAIRLQADTLLGGTCVPIRTMLAIGQSQSSFRLAGYVNQTHSKDRVYDGYLLHSGLEPATNNPPAPVFVVRTMSEGNGGLAEGPNLAKWMVAGATHNDQRLMTRGADLNNVPGGAIPFECRAPVNSFPSHRIYNAALGALHAWVRDGKRPTPGKPFELAGNRLAFDEHGNAKGGVRSPEVEAPIATYSLTNGPKNPLDFIGQLACGMGGSTIPFAATKLSALYPTHDAYLEKFVAAADAALAQGYLLQADYDEALREARAARVPN